MTAKVHRRSSVEGTAMSMEASWRAESGELLIGAEGSNTFDGLGLPVSTWEDWGDCPPEAGTGKAAEGRGPACVALTEVTMALDRVYGDAKKLGIGPARANATKSGPQEKELASKKRINRGSHSTYI